MKKMIVYICLLLAIMAMFNCSSDSSSTHDSTMCGLVSITITPGSAVVEIGQTVVLTATGTFDDGETKDISDKVTWESSDINLAFISGGIVTTKGLGQVSITASASASANSYENPIVSNPVQITINTIANLASITISPNPIVVEITKGVQLTASAILNDNGTRDITTIVSWSVTNSSVASVSSSGFISGLSIGSSTVMARLGEYTTTAAITVTNIQVAFTLNNHYESNIVYEVWKGTQLSYDPYAGNVVGYAIRAYPVSSTPQTIINGAVSSVSFEIAPGDMLLVIIGVPYQGMYVYITNKQLFSVSSPIALTLTSSGILE